MAINFDSNTKIFKLDTSDSSYIFRVIGQNYLLHMYYGGKIPDSNVEKLTNREGYASFSPENASMTNIGYSPDIAPSEYSGDGCGDFRIAALSIKSFSGNNATDVRYVSHKIYSGKPKIDGLPATYVNSDDEAQTLELLTEDAVTNARVTLYYTVFENLPVITRNVKVENVSDKPFDIERVYSCCVDFHTMDYDMLHLYGRWSKERTLVKRRLEHGRQSIASKRGSSSHFHNPFVALASTGATEDYGEVYGFNLVYSGNFSCDIEVDYMASARLIMGINPESFTWRLNPGESFSSPEVVMVYSDEGIGKMSRAFHKLYKNNLIRGEWKNKKRPLLINSWEAAFFDFDDDKLISFAKRAKELGIEMLVMDDGWFSGRNDDTSSLGDWWVNEDKLKGGLGSLIERVNALGLKFGIWYEPEMISRDSELYRAHPDWCLHVENREKSIARWQYVLDMSRQDVRDNIFNQMYNVLSKYPIDYVKWDFNRNLTEVGSALLSAEHQKEVFHRYVLGVYEMFDRLTTAFPNLLIENCSGGGGRFDPGMLYFSPQIWCSDNTDPIERLTIQFGTSMCYPASTMGAHVSACERASLETKADVALWGTFGYELDPNNLSDEEKDEVRREIAEYHKYYELIHDGELYRLINPTDDPYRCAWEFVAEDKSEALLTCVTMRKPPLIPFFLRLKGLDANRFYRDEESGEIYSGALLMKAGLCFTEEKNDDATSFKKHFVAVQ